MNQYRHSKSSLFLMEIILNILFFSILATFCVQIFFKGYQLSKSTEKLHQADRMHVDRRNLPEYGFPGGNPKFHLSGIHESGRNDFDLL